MKIFGVIAEFNPFHNGHASLIAAARHAGHSHCVCVMSGNFVQRCEAAITEKRVRTEAALRCGADLIIELPIAHATASAAHFAMGAVNLLEACGCVKSLAFGSECGDTDKLRKLAAALDSHEIDTSLRHYLGEGMTFAKARQLAVTQIFGEDTGSLLSLPNNILAVEYIRAAENILWDTKLLTIKRLGTAHDSNHPGAGYASASYLRGNISELENYVPHPAAETYRKAAEDGLYPLDYNKLEDMMFSYLRRLTPTMLEDLPELSEGIEGRLYRAIRTGTSLSEIHKTLKTKRYTMSRVRRLVLSAFLDITADDIASPPPYLRILGMNARGQEILAEIRKKTRLPMNGSLARLREVSPECARAALIEERATDLYTAALPYPLPCGHEYTAKVVVIDIP